MKQRPYKQQYLKVGKLYHSPNHFWLVLPNLHFIDTYDGVSCFLDYETPWKSAHFYNWSPYWKAIGEGKQVSVLRKGAPFHVVSKSEKHEFTYSIISEVGLGWIVIPWSLRCAELLEP